MKLWRVYVDGKFDSIIGSDEQDSPAEVLNTYRETFCLPTQNVDIVVVHHMAHYKKPASSSLTTDTGFILETRKFLKDLLDRDMFHYAVSDEVRREARRLLGDDVKK